MQVLPFSTGVIMEPLPMNRLLKGVEEAAKHLSRTNWIAAAEAIMTTDTVPKCVSQRVMLDDEDITITGISKGSGMIEPHMATMLGFIATDVAIGQDLIGKVVKMVADASYNRITVDGDTSTNDSFVLISTGCSNARPIESMDDPRFDDLLDSLIEVGQKLSQAMVRDGEGATKFITITVEDAKNEAEALKVAYAVAHSPLVKTAFFASDPNLGRILAAVGNSKIPDLDATKVSLWLDDVLVAKNGGRAPEYMEEQGVAVMSQDEITVRISLGRGDACETVWTTDLSHDYVSINADYRSETKRWQTQNLNKNWTVFSIDWKSFFRRPKMKWIGVQRLSAGAGSNTLECLTVCLNRFVESHLLIPIRLRMPISRKQHCSETRNSLFEVCPQIMFF